MPKLPAALERSTIVKAIRAQDEGPQVVAYDQFVTDHLRKTGRTVQSADIAYSLLALGVGWLGLLLVAALVEHWLTPHGFGAAARYALFFVAIAATLWHVRVSLWPLLTGRINPLYTAHAIESGAPSLKNGLINLLTLRGGKQVPTAVLATLEQQAAEGIARAPEEAVVDRSRLVRMAGALVILLSAMAVYSLLSVKDPFVSAARIVAPWAKIAPPSRVRVTQVTPGDATLVEGQTLDIEARIVGLGEAESVYAVLTTDDGQRQNDRVPMTYDEGLDRYVASIPTVGSRGELGLSGEGTYLVAAGDGRSPDYDLRVLPAPTLVVTSVEYSFPQYTGLLDYTKHDAGDIRGIEGTRVTLHAQANSRIQSASLDFDGDGTYDLAMQTDEATNTAVATFELALRPDRATPKYTSYLLRLKTPDGLVNTRPAKHQIEVYPDYPPEVELVAPEDQERPVRLNEMVVIRGFAKDPDYSLSDLRLYGESDGQAVVNKRLLERPVKKFDGDFQFTPSQFGLQVGDRLEYWLEASDNRRPKPQVAVTHRQAFNITSPEARDLPNQNDMADAGEQQGQQGQQGDQDQPGDQGQQGQEGQGGAGGQSDGGQQGQADLQQGQAGQGDSENQQQDAGQAGANGQNGQQDHANQGDHGQQDAPESGNDNQASTEGANDPKSQGKESNQQGGAGQQREPSGAGDRGESGESTPVDNSGADDAEAFDRILDHLDKNQQQNPSADGNVDQQPDSTKNPNAQQDHQTTPRNQGNKSEGRGADTKGGDTSRQDQQRNDQPSQQEPSETPGGEQETPKGDPSSTGSQGKPEGSPGNDPRQRPTEKPQQGAQGDNSEQQDTPSPAIGKQESDSQSDQSGDRAGGGDEGGGQRGDRDGTGSSGQNTAADEGAGKSSDKGQGESGDGPGRDQASDQPTGEQGDRPGEGSTQRNGAGDQPGGDQQSTSDQPSENSVGGNAEQSPTDNGQPQDPTEQPNNPQQNPTQSQQSDTGGDPSRQPQNTGDQSQSDNPSQSNQNSPDGPPPLRSGGGDPTAGGDVGGDEANLDYARRKTDLVLEKLSEQLEGKEVDQELLDSLGWSEDDLKRFVERWRERKAAAQRPAASDTAKAQLDAALKSLGLKPRSLSGDTQRTADDLRNQASGRSRDVPLKFRQRVQRYNQGVSGAGD